MLNDNNNKNNVMNENNKNKNNNTMEIHHMKNLKAMNDFVYTSTESQPNVSTDAGIPSTKYVSLDTEKSKVSNQPEISLVCCC